ncbi:MAG: hypothetical protein AB1505_29105 [Candidatus Latescibacterota bacterium]
MPDAMPTSTRSARTSFRLLVVVLGFLLITLVHDYLGQDADWRPYRSEAAGFRVEVAGPVRERTLDEEIDGVRVTSHYVSFSRDEVEYAVARVDLPPQLAQGQPAAALLALAQGALVRRLGGRATAQRDTTVAGQPASAFQVEARDGSVLAVRSLMAGRRLYTLMAASSSSGEPDIPGPGHFFASFALLGSGGTGGDAAGIR